MEDYKGLVEFLDKKFEKIESRFDKVEKDISEIKDNSIKFQDKALADLETLKQEKTFGNEQDKRKTKVLEIHNDALKSHKILSERQVSEVEELHAF